MILKQWKQVVGLQEPPKGQTRRPVKDGEFAITDTLYTLDVTDRHTIVYDVNGRAKWETGKTYAVQRPDRKTVGRFLLTEIRRERLGDISIQDVFAEGVAMTIGDGWYMVTLLDVARELYADLWNSIYGKGAWDRMKDDDVWILEWPPVEDPDG